MELSSHADRPMAVQEVAAPEDWHAWLLAVPAFPVLAEKMELYRGAVQQFAGTLARAYQFNQALALQLWKLSGKHGGDLLQQHADAWPSDLGFGVWPDRAAPTGWNEDSIQDAAAAVYRGDEPPLPMHRTLLFKMENQAAYDDALKQMSGFGATVQMFAKDSISELRRRGREQFLPRITDARFRGGRVYLPMLDRQSVQAATSSKELEAWLCGAHVYVRESAEDRGVLVISRQTGAAMEQALETLAVGIG